MFDHQLVDVRVGFPNMLEEQPLFGEHFPVDISFDGV
jgi:hypothetical protein